MRRLLVSILGTLILAGSAWAAPQASKGHDSLRCTLTNKVIEKCCCEQRQGKQYCTLAKKTIEKCCCVPAEAQKEKKS